MRIVNGGMVEVELRLAFFLAKYGRYGDKIIAWKTSSEYSHVEIILEQEWISSMTGVGVHIKKLRPLSAQWRYVTLPKIVMTKERYYIIMNWIREQEGKEYDSCGIICSQVLPFSIHRKDKWFCSELVCKILQLFGVNEVNDLLPQNESPEDLAKIFKPM